MVNSLTGVDHPANNKIAGQRRLDPQPAERQQPTMRAAGIELVAIMHLLNISHPFADRGAAEVAFHVMARRFGLGS